MLAGERDRGDYFVQHLLARFFQLVLQMDVAGGEEGMNARAFRVSQ